MYINKIQEGKASDPIGSRSCKIRQNKTHQSRPPDDVVSCGDPKESPANAVWRFYTISIASPKEKKRYRSLTASR